MSRTSSHNSRWLGPFDALWERIASQSEVTGAILLEDSSCCGERGIGEKERDLQLTCGQHGGDSKMRIG